MTNKTYAASCPRSLKHAIADIVEANARASAYDGSKGHVGPLPSLDTIRKIISLIKAILFPGVLDSHRYEPEMCKYFTGVNVEQLHTLLTEQIERSFNLVGGQPTCEASDTALRFVYALADIRLTLMTDITAMYENDPASVSPAEVIFCYPGVEAMIYYRCAHFLLHEGVPLLPRIITELAHSKTGIDIHPGAVIGDYFSIDHGTGVVIGETCRIGHHVKIYQGVTLGAKNFKLDEQGHPMNIPRHPIIEDYVTIYANATILGNITIGAHSTIGGNVWVDRDIPPMSRILQGQTQTI